MRRLPLLLVCLSLLLPPPHPAGARGTVEIGNVRVTYVFGQQISFSATLQPVVPLKEAFIFYQSEGAANTYTLPLTLSEQGEMAVTVDIQNGIMRPFSRVYFWYRMLQTDDQLVDSPRYFFQYDDNRFPWETVEDGQLRVHWYAGDPAFGQAALASAQAGLARFEALLPASLEQPLDIYIYNSAEDVQETLRLGGITPWSGHTSPDWGVVLTAVAPEGDVETGLSRLLPHELAHVLIYRQVGAAYALLPAWLVEGLALATQAESDTEGSLALVESSGSLLPIESLCTAFPTDAPGAQLGYAEAESFTRFLGSTYGQDGLQALLRAYAGGASCEQGAASALGTSLVGLEQRWLEQSGRTAEPTSPLAELLPYVVVLGLLLLLPLVWLLAGIRIRRNHGTPKNA